MTSAAAECQKALDNFNSHAHVERDELIVDGCKVTTISTHTLTWSVTRLSATLQKMYQYFNSHAHVERDCIVYPVNSNFYDFNSHAHVERDLLCFTVSLVYVISTHTLTWSVTWRVVRRISTLSISTHTLTWSVTKTR